MKEFTNTISFGGGVALKKAADVLGLSLSGFRWRMLGECSRRTSCGGKIALSRKGGGRYVVFFRGNDELAIQELRELSEKVGLAIREEGR